MLSSHKNNRIWQNPRLIGPLFEGQPLQHAQYRYNIGVHAYYSGFPQPYVLATVHLNQALTHNPHHWQAYYVRALCYYRRHEYQRCINDLTAVIQHHPIDAAAYAYRALAHHQLRHYQQAYFDFLQAFSLDPHSTENMNVISQHLQRYKNYNSEQCDRARISLQPFLSPLLRQPEIAEAHV